MGDERQRGVLDDTCVPPVVAQEQGEDDIELDFNRGAFDSPRGEEIALQCGDATGRALISWLVLLQASAYQSSKLAVIRLTEFMMVHIFFIHVDSPSHTFFVLFSGGLWSPRPSGIHYPSWWRAHRYGAPHARRGPRRLDRYGCTLWGFNCFLDSRQERMVGWPLH